MTERDSHLTQEKGNVEDTLKMGFISRDCWPTGVERVTHALEGRKLIRETQWRSQPSSIPTFNHLPRSMAPLKFGIPSACAWLWVRHSYQDGKPRYSKTHRRNGMKSLKKLIALLGLLSVLCAIPSMAQITDSVKFEAPSAFYAGNAKMPAGSYTVSQPNADANLLLIEDANGSHSAFLEYEVVSSNTSHAQIDVTFNKYGNVDFLSTIWVQGQDSEMQILPSKVEQNAAKAAAAAKHSLSAKSAGQP
jgi:hypothetical protein